MAEKKFRRGEALDRGVGTVPQLPLELKGEVVHGFGRGSKELGCPTANIPIEPYKDILETLPTGVYAAWARVDNGEVYKAAMSIGWNPYYKLSVKTIEAHVMHEFEEDFYGHVLRVYVVGYIRPEFNFDSLEALKEAIQDDIAYVDNVLSSKSKARSHPFLAEDLRLPSTKDKESGM